MNARQERSFIFLLMFLALLLLACDLSSLAGGAATKPTVTITAPASGARVNAETEVAVQSTATDARGIAWLELWVDGVVVGNQVLPAPQTNYTSIQRWTATTPGAHSISVRAYNTAGAASDPAAISIEVVSIVAPAPSPVTAATIYASGTLALPRNMAVDLETQAIVGYGATARQDPPGADLLFYAPYQNDPAWQFLQPVNNARVAYMRTRQPDYSDCAQVFSQNRDQPSIPFDVSVMVTDRGGYVCFVTDAGRVGFLRIGAPPGDYIGMKEANLAFTLWAAALPERVAQPTVSPSRSSDLSVLRVLLRYDGAQPMGPLEITVCNLGMGTAPPFEAAITANGKEARLKYAQSLGPKLCVGVFSPGSTFGTYGITSPQNVQVQATVFPGYAGDPASNNTLQQAVQVTQLSTLGSSSDLKKYKDWISTSPPQRCAQYVAADPLGDPHEIKKQLGTIISIAPSDYELLANFAVEDDRVCQARIAQYLGIVYPHASLRNRMMRAFTPEQAGHAATGPGDIILSTRGGPKDLHDM